MVEKWREALDEGDETGAVLNHLSKTFYRIDHNLLIAKLNAYGSEKKSVYFNYSHLTKCNQKTKVNSVISSWDMLLFNRVRFKTTL